MKTNDNSEQTQSQQGGNNSSSSFSSTLNKGDSGKALGNFQEAFRSLGSAIPLNRHNTADRQEVLTKIANIQFGRIAETGGDQLVVKAENYSSGEFQGIFPVTAFLYESSVPKRHIYVYYLAHEIAGIDLGSRRLGGNGGFSNNALEIPNTIADVINDKSYKRDLIAAVARRKGINVDQVSLVQGYYFPKEASLAHAEQEGHEDAQRVQAYLAQVYSVFYTLINAQKQTLPELNLSTLANNLLIRHETSELPGYDIAGSPFRSDIVSRVTISSADRQESFAVTRENTNLVQTHAYVDAAIGGSEPNTSRNGEAPRQAATPHVIITKITSDTYHDHRTLLLGLLAAFGVGDRNTRPWISPLRLQPTGRGINTRDLGAFGLDRRVNLINPPAFVNTQNGNLSDDQLRSLLSTVFVDDQIMYSIDVDELSEDAWLMQTLQQAVTSPDDNRTILEWANALTNGQLSQRYNPATDGSILFDWNIRLPSGHFIDSDGTKRDIRTFDWLGVMNSVVAQNENKYNGSEIGLELSNIFTNENMSQVNRYVAWRNLVTVPNFVQTGWFQRYLFNSKFVTAFVESVIAALAEVDEQGNGRAELVNVPPANGLENRQNFNSNMFNRASKTAGWNNGNTAGFGGGFGGNTSSTSNSKFFN